MSSNESVEGGARGTGPAVGHAAPALSHPMNRIRGALDLCRSAFPNDGAEGESVHVLCDVVGWQARELSTAQATLERLRWGVARNAGRTSHKRLPRWAHVAEATGLGSTSAAELCRIVDADPDEMTGGDHG